MEGFPFLNANLPSATWNPDPSPPPGLTNQTPILNPCTLPKKNKERDSGWLKRDPMHLAGFPSGNFFRGTPNPPQVGIQQAKKKCVFQPAIPNQAASWGRRWQNVFCSSRNRTGNSFSSKCRKDLETEVKNSSFFGFVFPEFFSSRFWGGGSEKESNPDEFRLFCALLGRSPEKLPRLAGIRDPKNSQAGS